MTPPNPSLDVVSRQLWVQLAIVYMLLGTAAFGMSSFAGSDDWWLHGLWCFVGLVIAVPLLLRAFEHGFAVLLTDHRLMFLAAFSLYFLFGAALLAVGPEIQADAVLAYYPIGAAEALRVDAVNGIGFGIALLSATFARGQWLGTKAGKAAALAAQIPVSWVIGAFLLMGVGSFLYGLSIDLGFQEGIVPGTVRAASKLSLVAVVLLCAHRGRAESRARFFGVALALTLAVLGTLQFSKLEALLPLAAMTGGLSLRFRWRWLMPLGVALLVVYFLLLGNLVDYGRAAVGNQGAATFSERLNYLEEGWTQTRNLDATEQYGAWARFCYITPQAAALDFQDIGEGGDGLTLMYWVLVPRVLFPDKPEITKTGREFHAKITGQDSSSTGQGIFASGYYHGGWWGFFIASLLCGWILAQTSAIARAIHLSRSLLLLPFSLLGLYIAFRIDGDFVADFLGSFVFIIYPLLVAELFLPALGSTHNASIEPGGQRGT